MNTTPTTNLSNVRVHDAMHKGIIGVRPELGLRDLARIMAQERVHAIAISSTGGADRPRGIVSALDLVAAAAIDADRTAGDLAATEVLTISSSERLDHAAQLMAEHELAHLIVTDAGTGCPTGVLSTLDVVAAYGG